MKLLTTISLFAFVLTLYSCETNRTSSNNNQRKMELSNKQKAVALVEAFETGRSKVLDYVSGDKYIQHNLAFPDGKEAIVGFFQDKPTGITVKIHRAFEEGDLVVLHSTYGGVWNNGKPQVAFDVFRFENGLAVEHWDNLLDVAPPNASGRTQTDGASEVIDNEKKEENKKLVKELMDVAFIGGDYSNIAKYISPKQYWQHNPQGSDGLDGFNKFVEYLTANNITMTYNKYHNIIAEGNFVLTMANGAFGGQQVAYYDLFRLQNGIIVEHWDVVANIPSKSEWNNENGKF